MQSHVVSQQWADCCLKYSDTQMPDALIVAFAVEVIVFKSGRTTEASLHPACSLLPLTPSYAAAAHANVDLMNNTQREQACRYTFFKDGWNNICVCVCGTCCKYAPCGVSGLDGAWNRGHLSLASFLHPLASLAYRTQCVSPSLLWYHNGDGSGLIGPGLLPSRLLVLHSFGI